MSQTTQDPLSVRQGAPRISCLRLFLMFFRIGFMTFGGGFAMSAVLRHELVLKRKWLTEREFLNRLSTATSVPGPVALNLAFLEGNRLRGLRGAFAAAAGEIAPSVLVILLLARFAAPYFDRPAVAAFLKGSAIAVAGQIAFAAFTFARRLRRHWRNVVVCGLGLFVVSVGLHPVWAIAAAGGLGYLIMRERMAKRDWTEEEELALAGLTDRLRTRELIGDSAEADVRDVIRERDRVLKGRFDAIIEECPALDLDRPMNAEEFLELAADELAEKLGAKGEALAGALKKREAESGSAVNGWLALPHAVVEGKGIFEILMARSRCGVRFSDQAPNVQTIFVLVGSADERDFYLCALAAIAQMAAGNDEFHEHWLRAKDPHGLREAVLWAKRTRID